MTSKPEIDEIDQLRAAEYGLLSLLLGKAPDAETLKRVATLKGDGSDLGMAHIELAAAAAATDDRAVSKEFFDLFIGLGRGELLPYASYYLTGFLHERPLARVREDLDALGIERAGPSREPEDHIAILLEVMAGLARGDFEADFARTGAIFRAPSQAVGGADVRRSGDVAIGAHSTAPSAASAASSWNWNPRPSRCPSDGEGKTKREIAMSKPSDSKGKAAGADRASTGAACSDGRVGGRRGSGRAACGRRGRGGRVAVRARQGPLQGNRSRQEFLSRQPLLMGPRTC